MICDTAITAHLEIVQVTQGLAVSAFVTPQPQPTLRWHLSLISKNPGGTSNVTQGGIAQGDPTKPVGKTILSPNSQGTVVLTVLDGDREVARDEINFGANTKESPARQ